MQSRISPSGFDIRRWWSLESGKKILWSLQGGKGWRIPYNKGIESKSENLTIPRVTWHSQTCFWPLPVGALKVPKQVYCFLLALSKDQIHTFTAIVSDGEEWSQRVYRQKVERTSLFCCLQDGSHRYEGACSKSPGCLSVTSSWRGRECLINRNLNKRMLSSVPATTPQEPGLLLTREMEEMWEARCETERRLLAIVTITP